VSFRFKLVKYILGILLRKIISKTGIIVANDTTSRIVTTRTPKKISHKKSFSFFVKIRSIFLNKNINFQFN
jgi:hypothetical protein